MALLDTRLVYSPFEYQEAYDYWEKQQQAHWLHCVAETEKVFTEDGVFSVKELYEKETPLVLFNGTGFVKSSPMKKIANAELFKITTLEGYSHTVTKDHRVLTQRGWVEAQNLLPGDEFEIPKTETAFGKNENLSLAFLLGHWQGDGTATDKLVIFDIWKHEYELIPYVEKAIVDVYQKLGLVDQRYPIPSFMAEQRSCHRRLTSNKLKNTGLFVKNKVPAFIWNSTRETVLEYLKGLFYTDGTTYTNKKSSSIKVTQINKEYLEEVQLLLLMFGIKSRIYNVPRRNAMLPDGKGGNKMYECKPAYILEVTHRTSVIKLNDGIKLFELRKKTLKPIQNIKKSHPITRARFSALESVGFGDVFCVEVESEFKGWVCNGFITHNSEISMASDVNDWKLHLTDAEKHMIGSVLKGFTQAEIIIEDYWSNKVANWFKKPEIQMAANTFASFETIHAVSYAYLNQSLGLDDFDAFLYEPTARAKIDRLINTNGKSKEEIAKSIAVFSAFNEGVSLFSSFAILLNFSRFNKLKGVGQIISFSIRDESLHSEFGCWLFRQFVKEYPEVWTDELKREIYDAARLTIELEDKFIDKCFENGDPEGLRKDTLKQYMRFRANTKLQDLGLKSNWRNVDKKAIEELEWFDILASGVSSTDFFAARVSDYSKGTKDWSTIWS